MHAVPCMIKGQYVIRWILVIKIINDYYDDYDDNKDDVIEYIMMMLLMCKNIFVDNEDQKLQLNFYIPPGLPSPAKGLLSRSTKFFCSTEAISSGLLGQYQ